MNYFIFLIENNLKIEIQTIIVKVIIFVSFSVSNEENYKETHEWNYQRSSIECFNFDSHKAISSFVSGYPYVSIFSPVLTPAVFYNPILRGVSY